MIEEEETSGPDSPPGFPTKPAIPPAIRTPVRTRSLPNHSPKRTHPWNRQARAAMLGTSHLHPGHSLSALRLDNLGLEKAHALAPSSFLLSSYAQNRQTEYVICLNQVPEIPSNRPRPPAVRTVFLSELIMPLSPVACIRTFVRSSGLHTPRKPIRSGLPKATSVVETEL